LVKVLDFGISKLESDSMAGAALTGTMTAMGSPLYMSPEQMRSAKTVDARTDIWSLGVIFHELLTRSRPFEADTLPGLCTAIAIEAPTPLRTHRLDAPPDLERVVLRCLEKDRERRYANIAELAQALAPFASPEDAALVERIYR